MKRLARTLPFVIAAVLTLQGVTAMAQSPQRTGPAIAQAALAAPDREVLARQILDQWENAPNPAVSENRTLYGDLRAALKLATTEQLLDASKGRTYEDVWAALPKGAKSVTAVVPLSVGQTPTPQLLGDAAADLVYTPIVPCRIVDTRGGVAPFTGIIGPNSGNWFYVALTNYSTQGGFAGDCGIPTSPVPAAVAINLTSTQQTGPGNLRVINAGGGTPNVSLVNYVAGVNIANAAEVRSTRNLILGGDIYIYSANSASHAVVDIMGYFNPPAATPLDIVQVASTVNACADATNCTMIAACPAGYVATGGGPQVAQFNAGVWWVYNAYWSDTSWGCQARNLSGGTQNLYCHVTCARVPGH